MGGSKVTIFEINANCNKVSFDTFRTVILFYNKNSDLIDSLNISYSKIKYKNFNYDSFHFKYTNTSKLISKTYFNVNDSTKIATNIVGSEYKYSNDTTYLYSYLGGKLNTLSLSIKNQKSTIILGNIKDKSSLITNPSDTFYAYKIYYTNINTPDSSIIGLYANNQFIKEYQISYFYYTKDSTTKSTFRFDNKKLIAQNINVEYTNSKVNISKELNSANIWANSKDSFNYKNGLLISKYSYQMDPTNGPPQLLFKFLYYYLKNSKVNYIDYFNYFDASCTTLRRYKYTYDSTFDTKINSPIKKELISLSIYPNPISQNQTFISLNPDMPYTRYKIVSSLGLVIYQGNLSNSSQILLPNSLAKGFYFLQVEDKGFQNVHTLKLIVD